MPKQQENPSPGRICGNRGVRSQWATIGDMRRRYKASVRWTRPMRKKKTKFLIPLTVPYSKTRRALRPRRIYCHGNVASVFFLIDRSSYVADRSNVFISHFFPHFLTSLHRFVLLILFWAEAIRYWILRLPCRRYHCCRSW